MFPFVKKHLYLGQDVDGYAVVSFNADYTGGLMRSPIINPLGSPTSYGENYSDSLSTIATYNSGGSVTSTGGSSITTSFTDWRLPTKVELETIVNLYDNTPNSITPVNQVSWTSTAGAVSGTRWCMESGVGGYIFTEYDEAGYVRSMVLVRSFTL